MGRKPLTVKSVKNLRILIPTQPAQGIHLESALADVREEGSEFETPYLERNANFAQFLLQNHRQQPAGLVGGGLHCQTEANAVFRSLPSRGIEQRVCLPWVMAISLYVSCPCPVLPGQQAFR